MQHLAVKVVVGAGAWSCHKHVHLLACPHVGDLIEVGAHLIEAETVIIGVNLIEVRAPRYMRSEAGSAELLKQGWES